MKKKTVKKIVEILPVVLSTLSEITKLLCKEEKK